MEWPRNASTERRSATLNWPALRSPHHASRTHFLSVKDKASLLRSPMIWPDSANRFISFDDTADTINDCRASAEIRNLCKFSQQIGIRELQGPAAATDFRI